MAEDSLKSQMCCWKTVIIDFILSQSNFLEILLQIVIRYLNRGISSYIEYFHR